jgi:hypothetical protein
MRSAEDADVSGKKVRRFLLRDVELSELHSYGEEVQTECQPLRGRWIDTAGLIPPPASPEKKDTVDSSPSSGPT